MSSAWRSRAGTLFDTSKHEAVGSEAVVASNHPLASAAGLETFARGGMIDLRDGAPGEIVTIDNYPLALCEAVARRAR